MPTQKVRSQSLGDLLPQRRIANAERHQIIKVDRRNLSTIIKQLFAKKGYLENIDVNWKTYGKVILQTGIIHYD